MRLVFKILMLLVTPFYGFSQSGFELRWVKPVGGPTSASLTSVTGDGGGIIMVGDITKTDSALGCYNCDSVGKVVLLITDTNGQKIYANSYGGTQGQGFLKVVTDKRNFIWAIGLLSATDGNFPNTTGKKFGVVKFDSAYHPVWYNFYGSNLENDFADFTTTSDGGALILARTNYAAGDIPTHYGNNPFCFDAYLCKLDSAGNITWVKVLGGSGNQTASKVKETAPGIYTALLSTNSTDYMLAGINFDSTQYSPWLIEINLLGNVVSNHVVQGLPNFSAQDYMKEADNGLLLAGSSLVLSDSNICAPGLGDDDFSVIGIDSDFVRQWCKTMGGSNGDYFKYMSIINDSLIAIFGHSESVDGGLIRCEPFPLSYATDHGWLGLINVFSKQLIWQTSFCSSQYVTPRDMWYDNLNHNLYLLIAGGIDGDFASAAIQGTSYNIYLFKYSLTTVTGIGEISGLSSNISLYPNPVSSLCTLKADEDVNLSSAAIYDGVGRQVVSLFSNQQMSSFNFNCASLSSGLYFIEVRDRGG